MLLIIEIAMLVGGIYALVSAKVPSFLIGGGKYQIEGRVARLFGILLILPLPVAFIGSIILTLIFGNDGTAYAIILEIFIVLGVAIFAVVLARTFGQQVELENKIETEIAKKAQGALMYAIFSATGFAAIICCPLAIRYANQATKLIDENGVGVQYRSKANTARTIAIAATVFWGILIVCIVSLWFLSTIL